MSNTATPKNVQPSIVKMIPWGEILVPGNANIRQSMPEVKRLAASLADKGQLAAVIVTNGGTKDQPYTLVAGFRRMAAYALNGWQDRPITANVLTDPAIIGDPVARMALNWTENMQREDVSSLDQAEALNQLVTGTYPVRAGEKAAPVDKKVICEKFDMSSNHLGALVRVFTLIDADVKLHAKKVKAPLRLLIAMSRIKAKSAEALADAQHVMLQEWIDEQEALEADGRKRKERSDKGKGKADKAANDDGGTFAGLIKPTRKIDARGTAAQYMTVLAAKVTHADTTKEEKMKLAGMIELMRYLTGDLKKFPLLTKEDFIVLEEEEAEEEEVAAEEA